MEVEEEQEERNYENWTLKVFFKAFSEGWRTWNRELSIFGRQPSRCSRPSSDQAEPVSLLYAFTVLSQLCASLTCWIPSFILDVRLGLRPSQSFVATSYLMLSVSILIGTTITSAVFISLVSHILPGANQRMVEFITSTIMLTEFIYTSFGLASMMWLIHKRTFIHQFATRHCGGISLSRAYITRTVFCIFASSYLFSLLSEPMSTLFVAYDHFTQPTFFPQLSVYKFSALRRVFIVASVLSAGYVSFLEHVIPMLTCILICSLARHVDSSLKQQLGRLDRSLLQVKTPDAATLDGRSLELVSEFFLDTLAADWPELEMDWPAADQSEHQSLTHGGQLFLHKNLLKKLRELRLMVRAYDQVFGTFHLVLVCINGLLVAHWTVIGIVQTLYMKLGQDYLISPMITHTCFSATVFVLSNSIMFIRCHSLSNQMVKLRSQLFKLNLDLGRLPPYSDSGWLELELVWGLYDQIKRVSREVNFKFAGSVYYSKQCLLMIFSREISFILVYLQMVDIYTNV